MFKKDQRVKVNSKEYKYIGFFAFGSQEAGTDLHSVADLKQPNKRFIFTRSMIKKIHTHNKQTDMIRRAKRRRGLDVMPNSWQHRPIPTPVMEIAEPQETNNVQEK